MVEIDWIDPDAYGPTVTVADVAAMFHVSVDTVHKWVRECGLTARAAQPVTRKRGRPPKMVFYTRDVIEWATLNITSTKPEAESGEVGQP